MNRLHLRIYEPPADDNTQDQEEEFEPRDVIPFETPGRTTILSGRITPPNERARIIRDNTTCPECSNINVEPLELRDALISPSNRLPIPGTATIVGFHCNDCGAEWPVYQLTSRRNG